MRKSVALSAVFLTAILLGLSGRLPLVRTAEPAVDQGAASGGGQDPFGAPPIAEKPPAASSEGKSADGGDPFGAPSSAEKSAADASSHSEKTPKPKHKRAKTAAKAKSKKAAAADDAGTDGAGVAANQGESPFAAPPRQPSRPASMKITVGKATSGSTATELAASKEIIEKALLKPVTLGVVETPLNEVLEQLTRELEVNVLVEQKALNDVGIDPATPVTCKVTNLPLRFALGELLRPLELTWIIHDGSLVVTTPEEAECRLSTRVYDVSTLLVSAPDYPAVRSGDLGDPDPLFGPLGEKNEPELGFASGPPKGGWGGVVRGVGGMGMGGMMSVSGPPGSPPILQQAAAPPSMGGGARRGQAGFRVYSSGSPLDFDSLIDSITSIIQPTTWDDVGGPGSIAPLAPQQLLVVSQTQDVQDQVASYLDTLRHHVETRPQIRIEAHWLWLTEPELASLLPEQDHASPSAGDVVAEAAWKKLRQQKRDADDEAPGDFVEMGAFEAILKGQNGQLISGVSGRQTRVMITLIPVVGDAPAAGGGMGGMGTPATTPAPAQTPAPPAQTPAVPSPAQAYPSYRSSVGYQPVCRTIQEGGALEVRPCVVAEGKEILLDLRSRFVQREDSPDAKPQTPAAGVAAGANGAVAAQANRAAASPSANVVQAIAAAVDRPQIHHYRLETSLRVPAGRRALVGGLTYSEPSAAEINLYLFVKASVVSGPSPTDR